MFKSRFSWSSPDVVILMDRVLSSTTLQTSFWTSVFVMLGLLRHFLILTHVVTSCLTACECINSEHKGLVFEKHSLAFSLLNCPCCICPSHHPLLLASLHSCQLAWFCTLWIKRQRTQASVWEQRVREKKPANLRSCSRMKTRNWLLIHPWNPAHRSISTSADICPFIQQHLDLAVLLLTCLFFPPPFLSSSLPLSFASAFLRCL